MRHSSARLFAATLLLAAAFESCTCQRKNAIDSLIPEGQACTSDDRCETGLCDAVNGDTKKCLRTCTIGCHDTELCTTLGEDRRACVQERAGLCKACTTDADCPQRADHCIMVGETSVCGRDCAQQDCPTSYECVSATTVTGELVTTQCVPMSGTCDCVTASAGQQVACSVENDAGTCLGVKVCTPPEGYSACNARTPGAETCNNVDDDCDGQTDEGIPDLNCGVGACAHTQAACLSGQTQTCTPGTPGIESCNGLDDDCDGVIDNPMFLATDPNNCGACGAVCTLANAIPGCAGGMCTIAQCVSNFDDCNHTASDGCEVNLGNDVNNCQSCGNVCSAANATSTCSAGHCAYSCDAVHYDVNGLAADGCEYLCVKQNGGVEVCNGIDDDCDGTADEDFDKQTDINNCGTCNTHCTALNGTPVCNSGTCGIGTCNQGFKNCNNIVADGCETNIYDDTDNCGLCGRVCNAAGGQTACSGGTCGISCNPGSADCNSSAADGCERNIYIDLANCGGCGVACAPAHASGTCSAGDCRIGTCDPGWADCNNNASDGCEVNLNADPTHCGACATVCNVTNGTATCNSGNCGINCATGFDNCDGLVTNGCETNLNNDTAHCGSCATVCANTNGSATCSGGNCGVACNPGYQNCNSNPADGCEVNTNNDPSHCGGCNTVCSVSNGTPACNSGTCAVNTCSTPFSNCNNVYSDGCEINTSNNAANCGGCNIACNPANGVGACGGSTCSIATCNGSYRNCDSMYGNGCETDISNSVNNCGACGNTCTLNNATPTCTSSACAIAACNGSFRNCDNMTGNGCEVDTSSNVSNCGGCGIVCSLANATNACTSSACTIAACNGTFRNCDNNTASGCETNIATDVNNCGGCNTVCPNYANGTRTCAGSCGFMCNNPYYNLDGNNANGCEYLCNVSSPVATDVPDTSFLDSNCDGIDGVEAQSVFVATNGNDGDPGTKAAPKKTIQAGIAAAVVGSRPNVIVSDGTYNETITLRSGINVYGAYSRGNGWARSSSYVTRITYGGVSAGRIVTVTGVNITTATTIANISIDAQGTSGVAAAGTPGTSVYAVYCSNCTALTIDQSIITAGAAGSGGPGSAGSVGGNGTGGNSGSGSSCDGNNAGAAGGAGGVSGCGGYSGGNGGKGGDYGSNAGAAGGAGVVGVAGGNGGNGGDPGSWGSGGSTGPAGATGGNGSGGSGFSVASGFFVLNTGGTGSNGSPGNGGGGGGGGGGQGCFWCDDGPGNGGGGGGSGGCAGGAATGGAGGGSSFGIFLLNSTSVTVHNTTVSSGAAGTGGTGGTGGNGGGGGGGAGGGTVCTGEVGGGGTGGNGGAGGRGGHGGGGAGGYSYGIYRSGTTLSGASGGNTLSSGSVGFGGSAASGGNAGANGASGGIN